MKCLLGRKEIARRRAAAEEAGNPSSPAAVDAYDHRAKSIEDKASAAPATMMAPAPPAPPAPLKAASADKGVKDPASEYDSGAKSDESTTVNA